MFLSNRKFLIDEPDHRRDGGTICLIPGNRTHRFLLFVVVLLSSFALIPAVVRAQDQEQTEAFVYGINASIPDAVVGTFAPPNVDDIYILSDRTSILSPRRTNVYYWPITNEFRAAWSQLNEQVEGELEVLQGGQVVATFQQLPYTIHFSSAIASSKPRLYVGDEALAANERFQADQLAYRQASTAYQQARAEWLEAARQAQIAGEDPTQLPPGPKPPTPFTTFSTGLNSGYPVNLPEGTYQIRTRRPDGSIVPESDRDLTVFDSRRTAVGYEVVPEARWTFTEELNDLSDAILGESGTVLYLKPKIVREYPALAYERLQNPQYAGDANGAVWTWESGEAIDGGILEIVQDGQVSERIAQESYFVKQVPGKEYGYEILRYDPDNPDLTPRVDFQGHRLELSSDQRNYAVRLSSPGEELLVGSTREVRVVEQTPLPALLLIALIPIALGAALLFWRRRRTAMDQEPRNT